MKYKFSFQMIVCWLFFLLAAGLYLMTLAPRDEVASEAENRMLAAFPKISAESVRSGEFSEGLETFLSDKLPARSSLASFSQSIMNTFSILSDEEIMNSGHESFVQGLLSEGETAAESDSDIPEENGDITDEAIDQSEAAQEESTDELQTEQAQSEIIAIDGNRLVPTPVEDYGFDGYEQDDSILGRDTDIDYPVLTDDTAPDQLTISIIKNDGSKEVQYSESRTAAKQAVEIYNRLANLVGGTVNVLIPPESAYAVQYLSKRERYSGWESEFEQYMRSHAAENLNVYSVVDIIGNESLADEYLYFSSDHHWTPKGCYFAYREMMVKQGIIPVSWEDHSITQRQFYGTYYSSDMPAGSMSKDTIEIIDPLPESSLYIIEGKNKLSKREFISQNGNSYATAYVYGTVEPWGIIESRCNTGRKCMVIFDSFAKPLFPFLANHYDQQFICDLRHYTPSSGGGKLSEIINTYGIDDVYVVIMPIYVFGGYTMTNLDRYI